MTVDCANCGAPASARLVSEFEDPLLGMAGVLLVDSVTVGECPACGDRITRVPNEEGLRAKAALERVALPRPLAGAEIRFLRLVVALSPEALASRLRVDARSVERWESDQAPIDPAAERSYRELVRTRARAVLLRSRQRGEWKRV